MLTDDFPSALIDIATLTPSATKTGDSTGTISVPTSTTTSDSSEDDDDDEGSDGSDDSESGDDVDVPEGDNAASVQGVNSFTFAAVVAFAGLAAAL